ncbi:MAG TPA: O-antigen ligase family protein [Solirubrobacteraceae bacterium]
MSTLAAAPESAGEGAPAPPDRLTASLSLTPDVLVGLGVAAALVALVFLTSSSIDQTVTGPNTWAEIAITFLGLGACAAVVLVGGRGRLWGGGTVALFAAFVALAGLSILWSVQPDWSWFGVNQLVCYLSALAGAAAAARLFPARWPGLVGGIAAAMAALCAYSLLAKVFPATLATDNTFGRLTAPFRYWNAIGTAAALGLPPALWAASRRRRGVALRALTVPAMTLMISVIVLSYSRSAVLVGAVGIAVWLTFVPLRLRSALMLGLGGVMAIPVVVIALHSHDLTSDLIAPSAQDAAGHAFGPVLLALLAASTVLGFIASLTMDRVAVPENVRRCIATALMIGVALLPVAAVVALAASSRGLSGQISHAWTQLTASKGTGDTSARLTQLGSSRPMYWRQGLSVGGHDLIKGVGELGYGIARLRYTTETAKADQAHSYLIQTFADLGLIGVVLTLALLAAWCRAALRPLAPRLAWRTLSAGEAAERRGLVALAAVVVVFGIQSALDFTVYFPGVAIPALLCAGWLAGRGPLRAPVGRRSGRVALLRRPGAGALVTGLAALALIGAWLIWQPLRSVQAVNASESDTQHAFIHAHAAVSADPLAIDPQYRLAALYQAVGDTASAREEYLRATRIQPENPQPWVWLAAFYAQGRQPRPALAAAKRVFALDHVQTPPGDLYTTPAAAILAQATAELQAQRAQAERVSRRRRRRRVHR